MSVEGKKGGKWSGIDEWCVDATGLAVSPHTMPVVVADTGIPARALVWLRQRGRVSLKMMPEGAGRPSWAAIECKMPGHAFERERGEKL